ncbi:MAG: hypothetical protein JW747_04175 [Candidatus Aminicenantes bacterium]|nr:hypothetical protein [Candidatus Aminicenantes bacterium]
MRRLKLSERAFALLILLAYVLVAGAVTARHEIWRDEAQTFLMARDSRTVSDLLLRIRYDVHPPLWHLLLFLLTRVTSSPAAMQIVHLAIAAAAVWIFARYAPFSRLNKIFFALGYYALFEYGVIARNYSLGILFLFLFCLFYPQRHDRFLLLGACIALLSLTSIHAIILSAALILALAADRLGIRKAAAPRLFWPGLGLGLAGIGTSILSAFPHSESIYAGNMSFVFDPKTLFPVLRTIPKAFFPLPEPHLSFWNTSLLNHLPATAVTIHLLLALIVVTALVLFSRRLPAFVFYVSATAALIAFFFFHYFGYLRHHGFFFFVFLAALWLVSSPSDGTAPFAGFRGLAALSESFHKAAPAVLTLVLAVQALAGLYAAAMDIRHPFSGGLGTAKYLERNGLQDHILVGDIDYVMSSISVHLKRPIYLPRGERWGTYQLNTPSVRSNTDMNHITRAAERLSRESGRNFLLILNYPLNKFSLLTRSLRQVGKTGKAVVGDETFYLYRKLGSPLPIP